MSKDGGPAFPFPSGPEPRVHKFHERNEGMSLRDYFAIHCDQPGVDEIVTAAGLVHRDYKVWQDENTCLGHFIDWYSKLSQERRFELYAKVRYAMSDAMLKARGS